MKKIAFKKIFIVVISIIIFALLPQKNIFAKSSVTIIDKYSDTDTNFFDKNNSQVFLDQYEGNTILLFFWASWCGHCNLELPMLDNLQKDFRKLPFKVIAISEDLNNAEYIKNHFESNHIRYLDIFYDYHNGLFNALGVSGLPTAFLIDENSKMKIMFRGMTKWYDNKIRMAILKEIHGNYQLPRNTYELPPLNKNINKLIKNNIEK